MSQQDRILAHLKRGPITPLQAQKLYGCMRLAARISDLKDSGHAIRTQMVRRPGCRFARYWLEK